MLLPKRNRLCRCRSDRKYLLPRAMLLPNRKRLCRCRSDRKYFPPRAMLLPNRKRFSGAASSSCSCSLLRSLFRSMRCSRSIPSVRTSWSVSSSSLASALPSWSEASASDEVTLEPVPEPDAVPYAFLTFTVMLSSSTPKGPLSRSRRGRAALSSGLECPIL